MPLTSDYYHQTRQHNRLHSKQYPKQGSATVHAVPTSTYISLHYLRSIPVFMEKHGKIHVEGYGVNFTAALLPAE